MFMGKKYEQENEGNFEDEDVGEKQPDHGEEDCSAHNGETGGDKK